MNQSVAIERQQASNQTLVRNEAVERALERCLSTHSWSGTKLKLLNMPTKSERELLVSRRGYLLKFIAAGTRRAIGYSVSQMLLCYPRYQQIKTSRPEAEAYQAGFRQIVAGYVNELQSLPAWAVQKACDSIRAGTTEFEISSEYPPSTIQVRLLAQSKMGPVRKELTNVCAVLTAEPLDRVVSDEERRKIKDGFISLADELRRAADPDRRTARWNEVSERVISEIGREAFEAIPNA